MAVARLKDSVEPVLLIVEDDEVLRSTLTEVFLRKGLSVHSFENGGDAVSFVSTHRVDIALVDLNLPDIDGLTVLREIHQLDEDVLVMVVTAYADVKTAISAMKAGAYDYVNKPFELDELKLLVDKALATRRLRTEVESLRYQHGSHRVDMKMVGDSRLMCEMRDLVATVGRSSGTPVLIHGETGTGKELVANAIHNSIGRSGAPFIKLNCSAIPDTLLESELFGYEKGAFTDAKHSKKGLFELADGGTVFLDEIGDMDLRLQPKLLQVLEGGTFRKVGGVRDIKVDVRVVAATNRELGAMVEEKKFRKDLYYRLKVMVIDMPSLRERPEDVVPIARHFIAVGGESFGGRVEGLSGECEGILMRYSWPGNVRELRNIMERAMILAQSGIIEPTHLPAELTLDPSRDPSGDLAGSGNAATDKVKGGTDTVSSLDEIERAHILNVLESVEGNKTKASKILGISRLTLRGKLKKYAEESR